MNYDTLKTTFVLFQCSALEQMFSSLCGKNVIQCPQERRSAFQRGSLERGKSLSLFI